MKSVQTTNSVCVWGGGGGGEVWPEDGKFPHITGIGYKAIAIIRREVPRTAPPLFQINLSCMQPPALQIIDEATVFN